MKKVGILIDYNKQCTVNSKNATIFKNILKERGIEVVRVSYFHYDQQRQLFTNYVDEINGEFQIIYKEYKPDILWKKVTNGNFYCYNLIKDTKILPSYELITMCSDKWEMYLTLEEFQPYSLLLKLFYEEPNLQDHFPEDLILKPIRAGYSMGVKKVKKSELIGSKGKFEGLVNLYIVQEFKDFSKGCPPIASGSHDLRIVVRNSIIIYCYVRLPLEGDIVSYNGKGVAELAVSVDLLPMELLSLVGKISKILSFSQQDFYSLDFGFCEEEHRWYLIEVNDTLGTPENEEQIKIHFDALGKYFEENLNI